MDKGLIIRTVVLAYALLNNVLVMSGINALP
ncbi:phage holin, partial [Gracilibacillus dipsosauri]